MKQRSQHFRTEAQRICAADGRIGGAGNSAVEFELQEARPASPREDVRHSRAETVGAFWPWRTIDETEVPKVRERVMQYCPVAERIRRGSGRIGGRFDTGCGIGPEGGSQYDSESGDAEDGGHGHTGEIVHGHECSPNRLAVGAVSNEAAISHEEIDASASDGGGGTG